MKTGVFIFKKIFIIISFIIFFILISIIYNPYSILDYSNSDKVTVYTCSYSSNAIGKSIEKNKVIFQPNFTGVSFMIDSNSVDVIMKEFSLKLIKTEKINEGESRYYYSKKIPVYKMIDNKKVNVHIFYSHSFVKVGIPLIYGSF